MRPCQGRVVGIEPCGTGVGVAIDIMAYRLDCGVYNGRGCKGKEERHRRLLLRRQRTKSFVAFSGAGSHESLGLGITEERYAIIDMQFFVAVVQMNLDGALTNRQFISDFLIAQTTGCETDDFELT